jgi:hypothetical protein
MSIRHSACPETEIDVKRSQKQKKGKKKTTAKLEGKHRKTEN